jgi:hypothetical protein
LLRKFSLRNKVPGYFLLENASSFSSKKIRDWDRVAFLN